MLWRNGAAITQCTLYLFFLWPVMSFQWKIVQCAILRLENCQILILQSFCENLESGTYKLNKIRKNFPMNLMDLPSSSTEILKNPIFWPNPYVVSIVYWLARWSVDLMIMGSNPAADFFNFSSKIEILVEGDRRSIRFMGKKMSDIDQLRSATL